MRSYLVGAAGGVAPDADAATGLPTARTTGGSHSLAGWLRGLGAGVQGLESLGWGVQVGSLFLIWETCTQIW